MQNMALGDSVPTQLLQALEQGQLKVFLSMLQSCISRGYPDKPGLGAFYVIDSNRKAFEEIASGIYKAARAVLFRKVRCNRISVLLTGRKGVGKSSLLASVVAVLQK